MNRSTLLLSDSNDSSNSGRFRFATRRLLRDEGYTWIHIHIEGLPLQAARLLLILSLVITTTASAFAQGSTEFNSQGLTRRDFRSVACTGFYGTASFKCLPISVPGHVATAIDGKHKALVFISHGSGGLDRRHGDYAHYLASRGFDAVVLDHWSARGVSKAHLDYNAARAKGADAQNMAIDALAAAAQLIQEESWKSTRFGFVGESMGGSAAINVTRPYIEKIVEDQLNLPVFGVPQIAASVALYPGCIDRNTAERFKTIPLLILQG